MQDNSLTGQIEKINLASVFQNLMDNQATGTLTVEVPDGMRFVYFTEGRIDNARSEGDWQYAVGRILLRLGVVEESALQRALKTVKMKAVKKSETIVDVLHRRRKVSVKDAADALAFLQQEALYDLFTAERGTFQFREGKHDPKQIPNVFRKYPLSLDPNAVMLEAARRNDEMGAVQVTVGSTKEVLVISDEGQPHLHEFDETQTYLIGMLDGTRDVKQTCIDSGLGRYHTCMALADLLAKRIVAPIRAEDLVRLGDEQYAKDSVQIAVFNYRKALELNRQDTATRLKLAELLTELDEKAEAASEFKMLAEVYREDKKADEAAAAYRKAAELAPRDLVVREKLMDLLEGETRQAEALEVGLDLARLMVSLGLNEKALEIYDRVLKLSPENPLDIERAIALCYVQMGDLRHAVEVYNTAADRLLEDGQMEEVVSLLEEILRIVPEEEDAKKKLDDIHSGRLEKRRQHLRTLRRSAIWIAFFTLVLAWIIYDSIARRDLAEVVGLTYIDMQENDVDRALNRLKVFQETYPFTLASLDALYCEEQLREIR